VACPVPNHADAAIMSTVSPAVLSDELVNRMKQGSRTVTGDLLTKVM
jgi:hypothetical protein